MNRRSFLTRLCALTGGLVYVTATGEIAAASVTPLPGIRPLMVKDMLQAFNEATVRPVWALACTDTFAGYMFLLQPRSRLVVHSDPQPNLLFGGRAVILVPEMPEGTLAFVTPGQAREFAPGWHSTVRGRRRVVRAVMRDSRSSILDRRVA